MLEKTVPCQQLQSRTLASCAESTGIKAVLIRSIEWPDTLSAAGEIKQSYSILYVKIQYVWLYGPFQVRMKRETQRDRP